MKDTRKLGIRGLLNICPSATFWTDFVHAFGGFSGCLSVWEPSLIYTFLEIQPFLLLTLCNKLKEEMGSFVHTPLINEQVLHNFEKVVIDRNRCSELGWIYTKWASKSIKDHHFENLIFCTIDTWGVKNTVGYFNIDDFAWHDIPPTIQLACSFCISNYVIQRARPSNSIRVG